ncbi:MAG: DUF975 family protein [Clostridia bacterium]|nr:DUF975 family protein [Clostridia bacterium]
MDRIQIKSFAKQQLGSGIFTGQWMTALLFVLLSGALISAGSVIPVVGSLLLFGPVYYGQSKAFLKRARDEHESFDLADIVCGFKDDFSETFLLGLMMEIFIGLWSLLFIVPGIVKSYAYSMAFYVKVDHPEYGWKQCLDESKRLTNGHKGELFVLDLSFIGWILVSCLLCGLGMFWVDPYMTAAKTNAYLWLLSIDAQAPEYVQNGYDSGAPSAY